MGQKWNSLLKTDIEVQEHDQDLLSPPDQLFHKANITLTLKIATSKSSARCSTPSNFPSSISHSSRMQALIHLLLPSLSPSARRRGGQQTPASAENDNQLHRNHRSRHRRHREDCLTGEDLPGHARPAEFLGGIFGQVPISPTSDVD